MTFIYLKLENLISKWIEFIRIYRISILVLCAGMVIFCIFFTINNFGINTDTKDMLSEDLEWRKLDEKYDDYFPQNSNNLVIVIESGLPDEAIDAAKLLTAELEVRKDLFKDIYYFRSIPVIEKSSLLFLDQEELFDLGDTLASMQPFISRLIDDQSLPGLFDMLAEAIEEINKGEDIDLDPLLIEINHVLESRKTRTQKVSWHRLLSGETPSKQVYREFIITQPIMDHSKFLPAEEVMQTVREMATEIKTNEYLKFETRLTGSVALSHDELSNVSSGTKITVLGALLLVSLILIIGLGSVPMVFITLLTLLTGLIFTAAFATATVGDLNLISIAFAVLYIGLGVDFAIHFCLRYRELALKNHVVALKHTTSHIGSSLFICAVTTAIGFFSFIPTDYKGIAELGWISGWGMFISFAVTMTLLPAFLSIDYFNNNYKSINRKGAKLYWLTTVKNIPYQYRRNIRLLVPVLIVCGIIFSTFIEFDINTLNLQSRKNESVKVYLDLLADSDVSPWKGILLTDDKQTTLAKLQSIEKNPLVDHTVWLEDFIPDNQEEKLFIIDDMYLLMGDIVGRNIGILHTPEKHHSDYINAIKNLVALIPDHAASNHLIEMKSNLLQYEQELAQIGNQAQIESLKWLEYAILDLFPGRFETLKKSLAATAISENNLPDAIKSRWVSPESKYLVEIYPVENLSHNDAMKRFVNTLQNKHPDIIGSPVISVEAGKSVVNAFRQALISAFIFIALVLFLIFRSLRDTLIIFIPISVAALLTASFCVIFKIPINFANIITIPLLMGIGVDSAIHIMHRHKTAPPDEGTILNTSSSRAVVVSALTTITGIGNLAFSPHAGTASMGILLAVGITMTLLCTLFILPAYLEEKT